MPDDGRHGRQLVRVIQRRDNVRVTQLLGELGRKQAVKYITEEGLPLLHVAILHHNHHVARLLLDMGADPSFKDSRGRTALHAAADSDSTGLVIDLLKRCAVNSQDENGETPLHVAVQNTSVELVKWLIFAGADPYITNKEKKACLVMTTKNIVRQLLREFIRSRPPLSFAQLVPNKPFYLKFLHMSMNLSGGGAATQGGTDFLYYVTSHHEMSSAKLGHLQDEEEVIGGSVVDYRLTQSLETTLKFALLEIVDCSQELVLRLMDSESEQCRDVVLDITEIDDPSMGNAAAKATITTTAATSDPLPPDMTPLSDVSYVAHAEGRVQLDTAGLLLLLCRPIQQDICLQKGVNRIKARLDPRVEVSVPDDFDMKIPAQLQLEPSPPVKEQPALASAPPAAACEYESQTDYVKMRTTVTDDVVTANVTVDLPLPDGYSGGTLHLVVRTSSVDSIDQNYLPKVQHRTGSVDSIDQNYLPTVQRRDSTTSGSESEAEDEREARRWEHKATFSVPHNSKTMTVPMPVNKTLTVVEMKRTSSDEKLKKRVAKQYRKRRQKRAVFFVAARPWIGWRTCRDVLVVVTSPNHLSRELGHHLADGYSLVHVSGEFRVAPMTDFRLSVIGDLYVESGIKEAVITFRHVLHAESQCGNHCAFILRNRKEGAAVTKGRLLVEQKRKREKRTKEGRSLWKPKGELQFDMSSITEDMKIPSEEEKELTTHFSDTLLVDLVEKLQENECPVLGHGLGLSTSEMNKVFKNPSLLSPRFKCFELLRRRREKSANSVQFGRCLLKALTDLNFSEQYYWILQRLHDWPQLSEVEDLANTRVNLPKL